MKNADHPGLRLAVVAYWYPPANESGSHRPHRFVKGLRQLGMEVDVVAAIEAAEDRPAGQGIHNVVSTGMTRWRGFLTRLLQRILPYNDRIEWFHDAVSTAGELLRNQSVNAVLSTAPPLVTHYVAAWLKWRYGVVWVADFRDPLRGNPFRMRLHGRVFDAIVDRLIFNYADAIIMNTDAAGQIAKVRYPKQASKIHVVWNGFESDDGLAPLPIARGRIRTMVHVGTLYGAREPGLLVRSLDRLRRAGKLADTDLLVQFVGPYDAQDRWLFEPAWLSLDAAGIVRHENRMVPRAEAQESMATADSLLLIDLNPLGSGLQVPAKLFEYVRIGRPMLVITSPASAVERILERAGIPYCCLYPGEADASVDRKVADFLAMGSDPVAPSDWFLRTFDASRQAVEVRYIVEQACKGKRLRS